MHCILVSGDQYAPMLRRGPYLRASALVCDVAMATIGGVAPAAGHSCVSLPFRRRDALAFAELSLVPGGT